MGLFVFGLIISQVMQVIYETGFFVLYFKNQRLIKNRQSTICGNLIQSSDTLSHNVCEIFHYEPSPTSIFFMQDIGYLCTNIHMCIY